MARKLYTVEVTVQLHVVAKNETEARRVAEDNVPEEIVNIDPSEYWIAPSRGYAEGWDETSIPYGGNDEEGDRTVGEWLKIDGKSSRITMPEFEDDSADVDDDLDYDEDDEDLED